MRGFVNKIVWITGASSGIGEALVAEFANAGSKIVLSARRESELNRVQTKCGLNKDNSLVLPLDLEDQSNFAELTQQVLHKFGRIDILVNNGGVSSRAFVKDTPLEVDRRLMEINYFGTIALTKAVLPHLISQQNGHIVVMSSLAGKIGTPMRSAYSAAKHALHGFFDSMRTELWQEGINILLVCPGYIKTQISLNALDDMGKKYSKMDKNQENGMLPEILAIKVLNAIRNKKEEIYIGKKEILGVYLKRFSPRLISHITKNM